MGISCGATLIRYLLFFFNLLWLALGAVIIYFGIRITNFSGDLHGLLENNIKTGAIVVLVAGSIIFLIAFLGFCGACRKNSCMLTTYGVIILLLVIVQCVGAYLAFHYKSDFEDDIKKGLKEKFGENFSKYKTDGDIRKAIQNIQKAFDCCGYNSPNDYDSILGKNTWPASCCGETFESNPNANCSSGKTPFVEGCIDSISNIVTKALNGLGGVAIALVLIQLLIIVSACCLAGEVRKGR
jgi:CD63 antigen